ncbi:MAG: metallophosphoesterase [Chloroflexi bacterium]|nr:metallophosphoesterase [Chloroflexota bacterium]
MMPAIFMKTDRKIAGLLETVMRREKWLKKWLALGAGLTAAASAITLAGWAVSTRILEHERFTLEEVELDFPDLPAAFNGLRIVQASDMHLSLWTPPERIRRGLELALQQQPDLFVLTGDFVDSPRASNGHRVQKALAGLQAPLGVYAVMGNHDYWGDTLDYLHVTRALEQAGIPLLRNSHQRLERNGESIYLLGIDDVRERWGSLRLTLQNVPPQAFKILLAHEPDIADVTSRYDIHLQLSGHTHAGQIRLKSMRPPRLPALGRRYIEGLHRVGDMWLYVNRGLGGGLPPWRFNAPPEITVITLYRSPRLDQVKGHATTTAKAGRPPAAAV